jgi:hypothetical protein
MQSISDEVSKFAQINSFLLGLWSLALLYGLEFELGQFLEFDALINLNQSGG